jgi:hypothetical protein
MASSTPSALTAEAIWWIPFQAAPRCCPSHIGPVMSDDVCAGVTENARRCHSSRLSAARPCPSDPVRIFARRQAAFHASRFAKRGACGCRTDAGIEHRQELRHHSDTGHEALEDGKRGVDNQELTGGEEISPLYTRLMSVWQQVAFAVAHQQWIKLA